VVPGILRRKDWCSRRTKSGRPSLICDDLLQKIEGEIRANRRGTITSFPKCLRPHFMNLWQKK
jgi:hypothetical protein